MSEEHAEHSHPNYVKIWAILVGLLVVSVIGPMFEVQALTLITAFGIAIIKALMVAGFFMHLNVEKKLIWYLLILSVVALGLLFFGVAPDVMNEGGANWENNIAPADATHPPKEHH